MNEILKLNYGRIPNIPRCPLCSQTGYLSKARVLYGHTICTDCRGSFANHRGVAQIVDSVFVTVLLLPFTIGLADIGGTDIILLLWIGLYLMKDGLSGYSPGKALFGLRTIHDVSGKPIGVVRSIQRNLPLLFPVVPLVALSQLRKGYRIGDKWAASKVVWKRYASHPAFLAKSDPRYERTPAQMKEQAQDTLLRATRLDMRGRSEEALKSYEEVIVSFPRTEAARDATICMENLRQQLKG